ncbi:hypothetical protein TNIN_160271 [Trichonephila inaurata madagascariensis]|uniref:Uncharacterized protein n=1 Tax=Trichonephila inaurata madagascariensis TaxID=2747483 RepID=A0A8X6Y255_9ARAC|nr:hypothetical protein TNIN_160271 [Trichonephila inaurata madagascariensis]
MQKETHKELLKKYNITECYVRLSRYDRQENKTIESPPKEGTPTLFLSMDETDRLKKQRKVSNGISIHVGLKFCVGEFKNYLTKHEYRAKILAKLNANSNLKLKKSTEDTYWKYQVKT